MNPTLLTPQRLNTYYNQSNVLFSNDILLFAEDYNVYAEHHGDGRYTVRDQNCCDGC